MSLPSARSIAFNRRLRSIWLEEGLRLRAEGVDEVQWLERMEDLVRVDNKGKDSIQKSMRYLRHIWSDTSGEDPLRTDAIRLYKEAPNHEAAQVLSWGMAIATYPFLNEVAATVGRMLKVQPELKLEQLLRKLSETHGEKESVRRSARYSLGLIHDLGFVRRTESFGCYELTPTRRIAPHSIASWFVQAWFRTMSNDGLVDRATMNDAPSLAFFDAPALIASGLQQGVLEAQRLSYNQEFLKLVETGSVCGAGWETKLRPGRSAKGKVPGNTKAQT